MSIILPFLVFHVYNYENFQILNGYRKKMLFLRLIDVLMANKHVNLEHQAHLLIKYCQSCMLSENISMNSEFQHQHSFRNYSAILLAKFCHYYNYKYPELKSILFSSFKSYLENTKNQSSQNYVCIINAIFTFFSRMSSQFLTTKILQFMIRFFIDS